MNLKSIVTFLTLLFLALIVVGCSSTTIDQYEQNKPQLIIEEFFNGSLSAHGIVKNRSGEVIRYFTADLEGEWDNGQGLLKERFVFDDGEIQFRDWRLIPKTDNDDSDSNADGTLYTGTAGDVIGDADVQVSGNAMFIRYVLSIPYGDSTINVNVDDRMYLVSENVLINESILTKWGINVGEVVLTIIKDGTSD